MKSFIKTLLIALIFSQGTSFAKEYGHEDTPLTHLHPNMDRRDTRDTPGAFLMKSRIRYTHHLPQNDPHHTTTEDESVETPIAREIQTHHLNEEREAIRRTPVDDYGLTHIVECSGHLLIVGCVIAPTIPFLVQTYNSPSVALGVDATYLSLHLAFACFARQYPDSPEVIGIRTLDEARGVPKIACFVRLNFLLGCLIGTATVLNAWNIIHPNKAIHNIALTVITFLYSTSAFLLPCLYSCCRTSIDSHRPIPQEVIPEAPNDQI